MSTVAPSTRLRWQWRRWRKYQEHRHQAWLESDECHRRLVFCTAKSKWTLSSTPIIFLLPARIQQHFFRVCNHYLYLCFVEITACNASCEAMPTSTWFLLNLYMYILLLTVTLCCVVRVPVGVLRLTDRSTLPRQLTTVFVCMAYCGVDAYFCLWRP